MQLRASAKGWAAMWLKDHPYNRARSHRTLKEHEDRALRQGLIAVNSILRDWIKGQMTAIECGILKFEAVFMPYMLTDDGRSVIDRVKDAGLLPEPDDERERVVKLPGKAG